MMSLSEMKRCPICAETFAQSTTNCPDHGLPLVAPRLSKGLKRGPLTGGLLAGRYLIGGLAGRGGMGAVYEAENLRVRRRVAIKVLQPQLLKDVKMRMRLFHEMQATSRVKHPNVVEIFDCGDDPEVGTYLVMEFLDGVSLRAVINERSSLSVPFACRITAQLASALAATHSQGLIHRDLKPSNVRMLPNGTIKILDFGLVKTFHADQPDKLATLTTGGIAYGTPWYMSPEQASFADLDPRSDLYSLGILFYEMLVGRPPFRGKNPMDIIDAHRHTPLPLPRELSPPVHLPPQLELILVKMLNKRPEQRQMSMAELLDDLYGFAKQQSIDLTDVAADWGPSPNRAQEMATNAHTTEDDSSGTELTDRVQTQSIHGPSFEKLLAGRVDELVDGMADVLLASIPRYQSIGRDELRSQMRLFFNAAIVAIDGEAPDLGDQLRELASRRVQRFSVVEVLGALWVGLSHCRAFLRDLCDGDIDQLLNLQSQLDERILPFYLRLVEFYFAGYNADVVRLNEALQRRNEDLLQLRSHLSSQVKATSVQLIEAERLKATVADNISAGLLLLDRHSYNVLLFNRSMERLCGITAEQALGKPIADVLHFVEGVPWQEFNEQLQIHGEVGLRKLHLRLPDGAERSVYVRGQLVEGTQSAGLFVVEDVTSRDRAIGELSRYLPSDVVNRVLRSPTDNTPHGRHCNAGLLVVRLANFDQLSTTQSPHALATALSLYVDIVGRTARRHGGHLSGFSQSVAVITFLQATGPQIPAVRAAIDIRDHCLAVSNEVSTPDEVNAQLINTCGVHTGMVFVLNVGSMTKAQLMAGPDLDIAHALCSAGQPYEIVASDAAAGASDLFIPGPRVPGPSQQELATFRIRI